MPASARALASCDGEGVGRERRTAFLGCWTKSWASLIISGSLPRVLARSTIASAASCWSQFLPAARRLVKASWEIGLHWAAPPAFSCALV